MKPRFDADIFGEIRARVVEHNHAVDPEFQVKLGKMKAFYKAHFGGKDPHLGALTKIDQHLADLRAAAEEKLEKARRPGGRFDPGEHPRGRGGQFAETAGGHAIQVQGGVNAPVTVNAAGHPMQVIPETRYSQFGPPIAGAAGIGLGAITGASARYKGNMLDRAGTSAARFVGSRTGGLLGRIVVVPAIRGSRNVIRAVNRKTGASLPHPARVDDTTIQRIQAGGRKAGGWIGEKIGHTAAFVSNAPAASARAGIEQLISGRKGRLIGRGFGALAGAVVPGAIFYAPTLAHGMARVGPYLDTAFPRHVRKADGSVISEDEILAKQDELLKDADFLDEDELAKALNPFRFIGPGAAAARAIVPRILAATRRQVGRAGPGRSIYASIDRIRARAPAPIPPVHDPLHPSAQRFGQPDLAAAALRARPKGTLRDVIGHAVPFAAAGAGIGAIGGAASPWVRAQFNQKHPRDERGRWASKGSAARSGARMGAAIGLGLGVAGGLIAARHGRSQILRQALEQMGFDAGGAPAATAEAREAATTAGTTIRTHLHAQVAEHARETHAIDYAKSHKIDVSGVSDQTAVHTHVKNQIEAAARTAWETTGEGRALAGGPKAWYQHRLDREFDRSVFDAMMQHNKTPNKQGRLVGNVIGRDGKRISKSNAVNLINQIDEANLKPEQRVLWKDHLARRKAKWDEIDADYEARRVAVETGTNRVAELETRRKGLMTDVRDVPVRGQALIREKGTQTRSIVAFARRHLGIELKPENLGEAKEQLDTALKEWETETNGLIGQLDQDILAGKKDLTEAAAHAKSPDFTDAQRMAIKNPFSTGAKDEYLSPPPQDYEAAAKAHQEEISKPFVQENDKHAKTSVEHLDALHAARAAMLRAGLAENSLPRRVFDEVAGKMVGWLSASEKEVNELRQARARGRPPKSWLRQWDDLITKMQNDPRAAWRSVAAAAKAGADYGNKGWKFTVANWRSIVTAMGIGSALGVIDLNAPAGKQRVRLNPKNWHRPKGLRWVTTLPNPITKPNEVVMGLVHQDTTDKNREKFLYGIHVYTEKADYHTLPTGTDLEQVLSHVKSGGGGKTNEIRVKDMTGLRNKIETLRNERHIASVGPADQEFEQRSAGDPGNFEKEAADNIYNRFIKGAENAKSRSTFANNPNLYWTSLNVLFNDEMSPILDSKTRFGLLVGGNGRPRGIVANRNGTLDKDGSDKQRVKEELIEQFASDKNPPPTEYEHLQNARRAVWLVAEKFGLDTQARDNINTAIDRAFTKNNSKPATADGRDPNAADAEKPAGGLSAAEMQARTDQVINQFEQDIPSRLRTSNWKDQNRFRDSVRARYERGRAFVQTEADKNGEVISEATLHARTINWIKRRQGLWTDPNWQGGEDTLNAQEPTGDLAKDGLRIFLRKADGSPAGFPRPPRAPRPPRISGSAIPHQLPHISGAATPRGPTASYLHAEAHPARAFGQIGAYGLGQAGYAAAKLMGDHYFPGGGTIPKIARFGAEAIGGTIGGVGGQLGGQRLGQRIAGSREPRMNANEGLVRGGAGLLGTMAGTPIANRAIKAGVGRAIGRGIASIATKGLGERVGGWIGGRIGGAAGAAAGTAAAPGVGTAGGGLGGYIAGQAVGAGVGWLADEGVGLLYRHLSRYGDHVPHMAAKTLGATAPRHPRLA